MHAVAVEPALCKTFSLSGQPEPVRDARRAALAYLDGHGLLDHGGGRARDNAATALLVVSELVTNAFRHADGPVELCLDVRDEKLLIEVSDGTHAVPQVRPVGERGADGGYGLGLVLALAGHWSVRRTASGKTVLVALALPGRAADGPSGTASGA